MKASPFSLLAGFVALATCTAFHSVEAAANASDVASNYTSSTWTTGSNLGTGFGAWNLFGNNGNNGHYGNYVGASGLSSNSFSLFSGDTNSGAAAYAQRPFTGALTAGQTFSVDLGHTQIATNGSVGLTFQSVSNGTATNVVSLIANGSTLSLNDGGTSNFGVGTDANNADIKFTFTYNGGNSYSFTLTGSGGGTNYIASNDLSNINQVQFFDNQEGNNQNFGFDNLAVVPEPATYLSGVALVFVTVLAGRKRLRRMV